MRTSNVRQQMNHNQYRERHTGNVYMYTTAAPKVDFGRQLEEEPRRSLSNEARKNREKAAHMSFGYVAFLVSALVIAGVVLTGYIRLQSELSALTQSITAQEAVINRKRVENAEALTRIDSAMDMEEIRRIALQELGMTYPKEGQIISYEYAGSDYMRKVTNSN